MSRFAARIAYVGAEVRAHESSGEPHGGRVLAGVFLTIAVPGVSVAQARLGPELAVNTYTTNDQGDPRVAVAEDGSFVVAWEGNDGSFGGIFARRYDAAGNPARPRAFGQHLHHRRPGLAGRRLVVGRRLRGGLEEGLRRGQGGVFARRFDSAGTPLADEFQVNGYTPGPQGSPAVAANPDGAFVVVWGGAGSTDTNGVFARRFDAAGAGIGSAFRVNDVTGGGQQRPAVTFPNNGEFVVVFETFGAGPIDLVARRFDTSACRRHRVPGQHLHDRQPVVPVGLRAPGQRLRRRLEQQRPGRRAGAASSRVTSPHPGPPATSWP